MPLHLLGKKSWNVYNTDNIERVRRDEAEAQAREEAEEQRLQQEDAARRIGVLRGEKLPEPVALSSADKALLDKTSYNSSSRPSKRRRLRGEDDTDKEIRWAREDAELGREVSDRIGKQDHKSDAPLHDEYGHIQLMPDADVRHKHAERRGTARDVDEVRDPRIESHSGMRFKDAAGHKSNGQSPWYAISKQADVTSSQDSLALLPEKNVWGDEDPRRRARESTRVASNDPLAFMKQAQRQLKQSEHDRERWKQDQRAEMQQMDRDERRHRSKTASRSSHVDHVPKLDLNASAEPELKTKEGGHVRKHDRHHTHHHRHKHRHRHRDHPL